MDVLPRTNAPGMASSSSHTSSLEPSGMQKLRTMSKRMTKVSQMVRSRTERGKSTGETEKRFFRTLRSLLGILLICSSHQEECKYLFPAGLSGLTSRAAAGKRALSELSPEKLKLKRTRLLVSFAATEMFTITNRPKIHGQGTASLDAFSEAVPGSHLALQRRPSHVASDRRSACQYALSTLEVGHPQPDRCVQSRDSSGPSSTPGIPS